MNDYRTMKTKDAERLCMLIRHDNRRSGAVFAAFKCWLCMGYSKGQPYRMFGKRLNCSLVTKRFNRDQRLKTHTVRIR